MTKEEAVAYFKRHINLYCVTGVCREAEEMAIKALSVEPCEDAISRQAVINGVDNYIEKAQSTSVIDDFISFEELVVKSLPPVTPIPNWCASCKHNNDADNEVCLECEYDGLTRGSTRYESVLSQPKIGRWLAVENEDMETVGCYCSECDLPLETEERTPFCPNCGAKMEVEQNG